jgi:membrane protease YdiL (CAAX protease family)
MIPQDSPLLRDPQIRAWNEWLLATVLVVVIAVLVIDAWLAIRWIYFRVIQRVADRRFAYAVIETEETEPQSHDETGAVAMRPAPEAGPHAMTEGVPVDALPPFPPIYTPNTPPFRPVQVFLGGQFAFILTVVGAAIASIPLAIAALCAHPGKSPLQIVKDPALMTAVLSDPALAKAGEMVTLFMQTAALVAVVMLFANRAGTSLRRIGLRKPARRQVLLAMSLGLGMIVVTVVVDSIVETVGGHILPHGLMHKLVDFTSALTADALEKGNPSVGFRLLFLIAAAVVVPIGEEVFFRGFLYNALKARYTVRIAIVMSGLIFALIHVGPIAIVLIWPIGMILAYAYEKTGSLTVTILMHGTYNGVQIIALDWILPHLTH